MNHALSSEIPKSENLPSASLCGTDRYLNFLFNSANPPPFLGAILIFLPGYDEIVSLRDRILFDDKRFADNAHR